MEGYRPTLDEAEHHRGTKTRMRLGHPGFRTQWSAGHMIATRASCPKAPLGWFSCSYRSHREQASAGRSEDAPFRQKNVIQDAVAIL
jgi:hypothetical protein